MAEIDDLVEAPDDLEVLGGRLAEADPRIDDDLHHTIGERTLGLSAEEAAHVVHDVAVIGKALHRRRIVDRRVHHDDRHLVTHGDSKHRPVAQARDVVDHRHASVDRRLRHGGVPRVDADRHAQRHRPLDHWEDPAELVVDGHRLGARPRGLAADVDDVGTLGDEPRRVLDRVVDCEEATSVRERVGRDVDDPHQANALERQRSRPESKLHHSEYAPDDLVTWLGMASDTFTAFTATAVDGEVTRTIGTMSVDDLPPDGLLIEVERSSVNYKDGLATTANGKVARISPLIPGIDLAGTIRESDDEAFPVGAPVIAHGYDLGVSRHGGFAQLARVPADWLVRCPPGLDLREAMTIGTAGFTAALSVLSMEERGLEPADGPVLVTGASGGVGSIAVGILARRGYDVVASTGKPEAEPYLRRLGAAEVIDRAALLGRWWQAAGVDGLGGGGRLRGRAHARQRARPDPLRRGGRGERADRRSRPRHDGAAVHTAQRGVARNRLGTDRDRPPAGGVGAARR